MTDFNYVLLSKLCETFFCRLLMYNNNNDNNNNNKNNNKKIIIINVKSFPERHFFVGIQLTVFENKHTFMKKLFCIQPLWCNAKLDKFYTIYSALMPQIWHLWQELLKPTSKMWKPEGINYIVIEDLNLRQILEEALLELIS